MKLHLSILLVLAGAAAHADPIPGFIAPTASPAPATNPPPPALVATAVAVDPLEQHPWSIAVIAGSSIPINGFNYNEGVGVRVATYVSKDTYKHIYVGGVLGVHAGDTHTITWGPTAFSNKAGDQHYTSHPLFAAADAGYSFEIPIGGFQTLLTPCLSAGVMLIPMDTDGIYGSTSITNTYAIFGFGSSYDININDQFFVGAHFRLYDTGDTSFQFGDLSQNTYQHGFTTSVFYYALYSELGYRF